MANIPCSDSIANVLGLRWDTDSDSLRYPDKELDKATESEPLVTKREIVRATASLYDPLGFITPVHINAKIFVQKLWKAQLQWDEPLQSDLRNEWVKICHELQTVSEIQIPRYPFNSDTNESKFELHAFSDASKKAYGAAVYLRNPQTRETALVLSKSRVTPVKPLTIPRAELMGVLLGSRLLKFVHSSLNEQISIDKCYLWSDSQAVLYWLQNNKKLPCFVSNRITEIKANELIGEYKYCPTADNPADLLSRGILTSQLAESTLWWHGPQWLKLGDWPVCEVFDSQVLHVTDEINAAEACKSTREQPVATHVGISEIIDSTDYSSLTRLLRVSAYVLRFVNNLKGEEKDRKLDPLTAQEINAAESLWIRDTQKRAYSTEIKALNDKQKSAGPLAHQLRLFIDKEGFVRVGGRLHNAPLSWETKFPLLLPRENHFTKLIVIAAHWQIKHSGSQTTITHIRQRFWIPQIRPFVKSILRRCVVCRVVCGKPYRKPIPAPLQSCRLSDAPPFTVTGVDFTGAVYVSVGKSEQKAYICLFTCAVTRAIHLELVANLSSETFLRAFRRFAARRSLPRKIMSDNGSTYLSAATEIENMMKSVPVRNYFANCRVEWTFIPKRAPWFGGFWERLIGLTKTALKKVLGRSFVSVDELQTVLAEIEATLNDRPLTYLSNDPNDLSPLTPSHLLHGRLITTLPYYSIDEDELNAQHLVAKNVSSGDQSI
ncbi:uncharacterized protein [Ptychodera flava]|uniref:uncharacterized protein n=1 Tax=Ptychodera flava TaxID=63121 RepID=UPI00396A3E2D